MNESELLEQLKRLQALPHETEWVEFKEAKRQYDVDKLGMYFSALSNEANLKNQTCGWLVFGVVDKDRSVCGSSFRENPAHLDHLKNEVAQRVTGSLTFLNIYPVNHPYGRVVMFQIPPAAPGIPTAWNGHWYGRNGESLVPLCLQKLETIRAQAKDEDWSAVTPNDATFEDLDPEAVLAARAHFRAKNQDKKYAAEIDKWTDEPTPNCRHMWGLV